jgi:hypothetical protein
MTTNYKPQKKLADLDLNSELNQFDLNLQLKRDKAISVADYRSETGAETAALLKRHALAVDHKIALAYAERLQACSDRYNFYMCNDFVDYETGETFFGFGNLLGCGLKFCPNCTGRAAARNRKISLRVLDNTELQNREHFCFITGGYIVEQEQHRFVTLTMPKIFKSLRATSKIKKRAWDLFRKLKFTKTYFPAIIKTAEFTVRTDRTYHYHLHLLAISYFVPEALIKEAWTSCVRTAFEEFGVEFEATQANVNLKLIYDLHGAVKEVCKYITKSDSWEKIPAEHMLEMTEVKRWDRMFEISGRFRQTLAKLKVQDAAAADALSSFLDDKKATFTDSVARELDYFNTDVIIDGEASEISEIGESSEEISSVKPKRANWRDVVKEQGLEKYLQIFYRQVEFTRNLRKLRLIIKYPDAKFTDLDGRAWDLAEIEAFAHRIASRGIELGF